MEPRQIEEEVEALEPKVERLKALYEQYFLGLEKLEPTTLRSEVDRKLTELRKRRIQATRVRYKLQMIIQRYNTYQQYWARVTREMERGTYMRDVLRVAKRIGSKEAMTILGQKRVRMFRELARVQEDWRDRRLGVSRSESDGGEGQPADAPGGGATMAALGGPGGAALEDPAAWDLFQDDGGDPLPPLDTGAPFVMVGASGSSPPKPVARAVRTVDDDDAPTLPPPSNGSVGLRAIPPAPRSPQFSPTPAGPVVGTGPSLPPTPSGRPSGAPIAPPAAPAPRPRATPPGPPPPPGGRPPGASAGPPAAPAPRPPAYAPPAPRPPGANGAPSPAGEPAADRRMKEIYHEYVAARRKGNEPVDGLSYEKLRKSLERQAEQLRATHGKRSIDFEVVTKDGRTLIRPVVR